MPDFSCIYTLTTDAGTITFNDGDLGRGSEDDLYWISDIDGLDGAPIRAQVDNAPQTDGGIVHSFYKGARHVNMQGNIIIQSVPLGAACQSVRNDLEDALRLALASIIREDGLLSWVPTGSISTHTLTVRNDVPVDFSPADGYLTTTFTFGLVAANPNWVIT